MTDLLDTLFTRLAVALLASPLTGWCLMLLAGLLHHEVHPGVPPIGYPPALAIMALGAVVIFGLTGPRGAS